VLDPIKGNKAGLGKEILAAKLLDHDDQSNDFRNADSSKPLADENVDMLCCVERRCRALSPEARRKFKTAISS
jgi:hypothetical protein